VNNSQRSRFGDKCVVIKGFPEPPTLSLAYANR
jgi:hypothetical protein